MFPQQDKTAANGEKESSPSGAVTAPSITLPKGGGAIRGMGEKFAANPVTGTGSMSVPIVTSPGRSGFGPQLSLSYDSGAGNGPFGFGWSLSLPAITRKTDKGLPRYDNAAESDVFLLSGAEDLVPVLVQNAAGEWEPEMLPPRTIGDQTYNIKRYRPRIEGLFARIERWTRNDGDVHWRSISRDNVLTLYGKDENSRIFDPADPTRIFSWLICETRDDKGNGVLYEYKAEDGVDLDLTQAHERNRWGDGKEATANRYLKHIYYGNRASLLDNQGKRPHFLTPAQIAGAGWMFEVVFDYGEHHADVPTPGDTSDWTRRNDPFSSYRAGFEVRTYRLCQRVLMFHHFEGEDGMGKDCLVRSTDFTYSYEQDPDHARNPIYTFLQQVTQSGYKRENGSYLKRSLPPLEFEYTQPMVQDTVEDVDTESLENLPIGLDGVAYQWIDLHGEGIPGILTEQAGAWFYKRNLSPMSPEPENGTAQVEAKFAPVELAAVKPNLSLAGGAQFMDLAGDGQPDLVALDGPTPGLYEHDGNEGWLPFRPFTARLNRDTGDPNLKFVDLDGDGHADVLITEDDAFVWHASLAEDGFGPAQRVAQALDEEKGPRLVFADGTQSIYLADLSGDGLTDLARIRNGDVCYWPNLGYGRFGAKVAMDNAPWFDHPDHFDQRRIRLADIDGSGTTDIIYLHSDGVRLYFNQSGNGWSQPNTLKAFPYIDDLASIVPTDLLGNGTACLVWSSPLPGDAGRQMRYVNLMGNEKPHLLVRTINNLGVETRVRYAPSTKFYLLDKQAGRPWITRLPFPVHVVEQVETYDYISRNRFVTSYAYHHGYFDGEEREFRGFGMVEQQDTELFAALTTTGEWPSSDNEDSTSHVPPVLTRTWFHTGIYLDRDHVSRQFEHEYYREPGLDDEQFRFQLLPDTTLPPGLPLEEEHEACRALKGMMLRQEVYALDGVGQDEQYANGHPYTIVEQDFTIRPLHPRYSNRHGVFFTHPREVITYHYERNPADPRIQHALTLEVDRYGNVLKEATIGYGRRQSPLIELWDRERQTTTLVTYTENEVTNPIDDAALYLGDYRTPLLAASRMYQLTGYPPTGADGRYRRQDFVQPDANEPTRLVHIFDGETDYEDTPPNGKQRRLIEHVRTLYRKDDLSALLPLRELEPLALPGESYKLALTPGLLEQVFKRKRPGQIDEDLRPANLAALLVGIGEDEGGYAALDGDWWIPSGRVFYHRNNVAAPFELAEARAHFFLPHRYRDPFDKETLVDYDGPADATLPRYDLLVTRTEDAAQNVVRAENDYRVLQPRMLTDPNRNRTEVAFDVLGMVVGTAVMGKTAPAPAEGDSLEDFTADLTQAQMDGFFEAADPHVPAPDLLKGATTRIIYDLDRFRRTREAHPNDPAQWLPVYAATLARETHTSDPLPPQGLKIQISFSYSDGFGREIQKKIQAEPGRLVEDGPVINPRWVGSGWTIFNNKGKPVRQYEPFFSASHDFEFGLQVGVSPVLFYDPVGRVVATLHPNHTWEKVVFDPWQQATYDVNDTVLNADGATDPKLDEDVKGFFERLAEAEYLPTWYEQRLALPANDPERIAANKAAVHRQTPTIAHFDALGRPFLTIAHNRFERNGTTLEEFYPTRVEVDIEGNQRAVRDAVTKARDAQGNEVEDKLGRIVMRYDYDMLGNRLHQASMEAGERWTLNDATGNPILAWDSRGFIRRMTYDALRRPTGLYVTENGAERLAERTVYGEGQGDAGNHRTRVYQVHDGAGVVTSDAYDFKGNLLSGKRELLPDYKTAVDWNLNLVPNGGTFPSATTYDALNRPLTVITPDNSVYRPAFNEANLLDRVDVNLQGETDANGQPVWTHFVTNINYNEKGQRELVVYQNGAQTTYTYDPLTFRLARLRTTRPSGVNGLGTLFVTPTVVQDLRYTYDPAGNITRIEDAALATVFHNNEQVEPISVYTYDALYRLIEARGREHIGQTSHDFNPADNNFRDYPFAGLRAHPNDPQALRNYTERYEYDEVGNFTNMRHIAANGSWTCSYSYNETSLIENGVGGVFLKTSNRLSSTTVGNGFNRTEPYSHDAHGNMIHMPHLGGVPPADNLHWDYEDQLQWVDLPGGEMAYYVYDAAGQRVRKVIEAQNGTRREERIYLGGYEIFRRHTGANAGLVRETLHVMDDKQRIALVETRDPTVNDGTPERVIRYQFGNHLGSASLELDNSAQIISYEEYTPYGSASYQAVRSNTEAPKRYRYTGKERDEESGLHYHGVRYYTSWFGRWVSTDPAGIVDGLDLYRYGKNNPVNYVDSNGMQSQWFHNTTVEGAKGILEKGFEAGKSGWNYFMSDPSGAKAGAEVANSPVQLDVKLDTSGAKEISYDQWRKFFDEAKVEQGLKDIANADLSRDQLKQLNAIRNQKAVSYMNTVGGDKFIINAEKGAGGQKFFAAKNSAVRSANVTKISGRGAAEVVESMAKRTADAAEQAAAATRFGKASKFLKLGGKALVVIGVAVDAYDIYTSENKVRTIVTKVGGWGAAWAGAKGGAWIGGGLALAAGQAGPQIAAPEEIVTVPVAGLIGGIIGGVTGYFAGEKITTKIYDYFFGEGVSVGGSSQ